MNKSKLREQITDTLAEVCLIFDEEGFYNIRDVKENIDFKKALLKIDDIIKELKSTK